MNTQSCLILAAKHATHPLYPGSSHTVLNAVVDQFKWFCEHPGVSKGALPTSLALQKSLLPTPNELHGSYEAALLIIEPHIVSTVTYDVYCNGEGDQHGISLALCTDRVNPSPIIVSLIQCAI